jgi:hypothetical protein
MVIWYIFPVLVCCTKKYLATLSPSREKNFVDPVLWTPREVVVSRINDAHWSHHYVKVVSMTLKNWEKADREICLLNKSELEPHRLRLRTPRDWSKNNIYTTFYHKHFPKTFIIGTSF